jgi:hypothetical protein
MPSLQERLNSVPLCPKRKGYVTKFGLFNHGDTEPLQVYEGACLESTPPYTTVIVYSNDGGSLREVALIHVAEGQSVKEISPQVRDWRIPGIRR